MKKIIIIGCPGAGKSTFARALSAGTGIPLFHLDMIWHKADRTNISREEFDQRLGRIMAGESWIIDGNYQRTLEWRIKECDAVFLLDFPKEICLEGVEKRLGKAREDMPWVEETLDDDFKAFIETFCHKELVKIYRLLNSCKDKNVIVFKSREEVNHYIKNL